MLAVRHPDQPWWIAALFVAGIIHPTYLVTAWVLAGGLALARAAGVVGWAGRAKAVAQVAGVAVVASIPGVVANRSPLRAARGAGSGRANEILADFRLPHHANPGHWFEPATAVLLVVVVLLLVLARRHGGTEARALADAMLATAGLSLVLSLLAIVADDPGIRLLFPWRASIVVVPVAFALGAALLAARARVGELVAVVLVAGLAVSGVARTADSIRHPVTDDGVVAVVRAHPPEGEGLVSPAEEDLRLNGGHPIYGDFKNHPFAPAAVIAWWQRYRESERAMDSPEELCRLVEAHHEGWVVAPSFVVKDARGRCLQGWVPLAVPGTDLVYLRRPAGS
ncbi:MAG: hypothetical protein U0P45_15845 [Acidimicrobiales bacterium]